jgi:hypothetical protein
MMQFLFQGSRRTRGPLQGKKTNRPTTGYDGAIRQHYTYDKKELTNLATLFPGV